jgi:hypothetical protein
MKVFALVLAAALNCSGCALTPSPDAGPYRTPVHAYGFVSCSENTPIGWIRLDAASDPQIAAGVIAHETQHVLDFATAGGCKEGYSAYVRNTLWFEARAFCAGMQALALRRLAPPVQDQLPLAAFNLMSYGFTHAEAHAALLEHCFVRLYADPPQAGAR